MTLHTPSRDLIPGLRRGALDAFGPLQRELNRVFEEFNDSWAAFTETHFAPRMDVADGKEAIEISIELPGMSRDQVKITAEDDVLTISGEKSSEVEKTDKDLRLTERNYGRFSRSIYLPRSIDPNGIAARMEDGVLKITVPKRPDAEAKTIEIKSE